MRLPIALFLALAIFSPALAAAESPGKESAKELVKVELIANTTTTSNTQKVKLAVKIKIAPDWHIYWLNPGDSGIPTSPTLKLPAGWTHSPWQFPTPIKFNQPGDFVGYGYKKEVVLLTELTPPQTFTTGTAQIDLDVAYLVCESICLPGHAKVSLTLSAGAPDYQLIRDFDTYAAQMPHEPSRAGTQEVTPSPSPLPPLSDKIPTDLTYTIKMPFGADGFTSVETFPLTPDGLEVTNLTSELAKDSAIIKFTAKLYSGRTNVGPTLPVVVAWSTEEGQRVAKWFELPLTAPKP